jgi:hypothetical protein
MKMLGQFPSFLRRGEGWLIGSLAPAPTTPYSLLCPGRESFPWREADLSAVGEKGRNRENAKKMLK